MRALLVVNPAATNTTPRSREVLKRALASEMKVEVAETSHRGHAAALAVRAMREGLDVVVALGGDGTVNEVVNGLLTDGPKPDLPALAVVPGGSTNVFARAHRAADAPVRRDRRDPRGAAGRPDPPDRAGPGRRPVLHVQRRARLRRRGGAPDREAAAGRRADLARAVRPGRARALRHRVTGGTRRSRWSGRARSPIDHLHFALVTNTAPWSYLGERPVQPSPEASFDTGLDVFAPRSMGIAAHAALRSPGARWMRRRYAVGGCSGCTTWRSSPSVRAGRWRCKSTATGWATGSRCGSNRSRDVLRVIV